MALASGSPGDFNLNYDDFADMSEEEIEQSKNEAIAGTMLGDIGAFASMGSAAGPWGALIGAIVGTIVGVVDADVSRKAMEAELAEREDQRQDLQDRLSEAMDYRTNIMRHAEAMLHPVEQSFRTRARAFGAQIASQGLTGAQAISAQLNAENFYRERVGPSLPAVMAAAEQEGQRRAMLRLQSIESEHKIDLAQQQMDLQADMAAGAAKQAAMSGITQGISSMAMAAAVGVEDLLENQDIGNIAGTSQQGITSSGAGESPYSVVNTGAMKQSGVVPDPEAYIAQYQHFINQGGEGVFKYNAAQGQAYSTSSPMPVHPGEGAATKMPWED